MLIFPVLFLDDLSPLLGDSIVTLMFLKHLHYDDSFVSILESYAFEVLGRVVMSVEDGVVVVHLVDVWGWSWFGWEERGR